MPHAPPGLYCNSPPLKDCAYIVDAADNRETETETIFITILKIALKIAIFNDYDSKDRRVTRLRLFVRFLKSETMNNSTLSQLTFSMCTTLTLAVASNQNQTATMEKTKTGRRRTLSSSAVDGIYDIDPLAEEQQIIPIEDEGFIDNYKREGSGTIFSCTFFQ